MPKPKFQASEKFQTSHLKRRVLPFVRFGISLEFGAWNFLCFFYAKKPLSTLESLRGFP
jgi:hypothetical protein